MATPTESRVVYAAGLAQGIVLVTFPAAGTIFTDPAEYGLSSNQYGTMFLPQVILAIATSLLGGALAERWTIKRVYLAGLAAGLVAMAVLIVSSTVTSSHALAYTLLLVGTGFVGASFGLTVPALNTLIAAFHPDRINRSVLVLNTLLGLGTVLAPVFVAVFVGLGFWWGLPVVSAALIVALLVASVRLPLRDTAPQRSPTKRAGKIPTRFVLFAAFATLYGICETMNGNWAQIDLTHEIGSSHTAASLALTTFWAMVTVGRITSALVTRWVPPGRTYRTLPFVLAVAFVLIAVMPHGATVPAIIAFGLAGLGCSALLPLTISFGQQQLVAIEESVSGAVIAFYQLGYGIAAFGAGPLQDAGIGLATIFGGTAAVAIAMGALAFAVTARRHAKQAPAV
jgi:predicted MFS family arabinose efflux permease